MIPCFATGGKLQDRNLNGNKVKPVACFKSMALKRKRLCAFVMAKSYKGIMSNERSPNMS